MNKNEEIPSLVTFLVEYIHELIFEVNLKIKNN